MRVLFIAGQGRSGSTLIERVLAGVPGVCPLGEATHVWQDRLHASERCSCGTFFSRCEFWNAVGERGFGGWDNVDKRRVVELLCTVGLTRNIPRLVRPSRDRLALITELVEYQARLYAAAAAVSGARLVIDSSKYPALAFCLRWGGHLDLRVLHLVRDPRGVAHSWTKLVARPENDGATMVPQYRPSRSALRWSVQNAAVDLLARLGHPRRIPPRVPVYRMRYEDFIADPHRAVRDLAGFAGLAPSPADLAHVGDGYVDLDVIHSASGNPMRFATGRTPLRRDDAWRTRLPVRQRRLVSAICAPMLAAYGYSLAATPHRRAV